ncbi:MAG: hypothetical protein Q8M71_04765 [Thermodesulfovibrionales bacterium]|nr:hypothetical protein [Thermodesulfovibrionales bacterium]
MVQKKLFTIEFVAQILLKRGLISKEQYSEIILKGDIQKAKLQKYQEPLSSRRFQTYIVSPAEVISSFNIEIPEKDSTILTDDAITEAIAAEVKLPYVYQKNKGDGSIYYPYLLVRSIFHLIRTIPFYTLLTPALLDQCSTLGKQHRKYSNADRHRNEVRYPFFNHKKAPHACQQNDHSQQL